MSRRSSIVLLLLLASVLGVLALLRATGKTHEAIEPVRRDAPLVHDVHEADPPLVDAGLEDPIQRDARPAVAVPDEPVEAREDEGEDTASARFEEPMSLRVRLVNDRGTTITHGTPTVSARTADGEEGWSLEIEPGLHGFKHLDRGAWTIVVSAIGYEDVEQLVSILDPRTRMDVDVVLRGAPSVRVLLLTPDGEAFPLKTFPRPQVIATQTRPEAVIEDQSELAPVSPCGAVVKASEVGLDARHIGLLLPTCEAPFWVTLTVGGHVIESQKVERADATVTFLLAADAFQAMLSSVAFRVVDRESREPLNGAICELTSGSATQVAISERGSVKFDTALPGVARLRILLSGYEYAPSNVVIAAGAQVDLGEVALSKAGRGGVRIQCAVPDGVTSIQAKWGRIEDSRKDGRFASSMEASYPAHVPVVIELAHGAWRVHCSVELVGVELRSRPFDVSIDGGVHEVSMELHRVANLALVPAASPRTVTVVDVTQGRGPPAVHEVESHMVTLDLPIGQYEVVVHGEGIEEAKVTVDLGPDGARVLLE